MSQAASPMRSTRARKTVPTYNLKVLSGLPTRRTSKRSIDDNDHPHNTNGADTHMSTSGSHGDSKASTPEDNLGPMFSNISSELTSPMRSPGLAALETSLEDEAVAAAAPGSTTASQNKGIYNCFNTQMHPKGHFYSANQLYARGIWIGYLSPDRMNEPFRGLPSFNKLKVNFSKFSPPHPQPVQGTARENRNAVCRGCVTSTSAVIALSEIQFFGKTVRPSSSITALMLQDLDTRLWIPSRVELPAHALTMVRNWSSCPSTVMTMLVFSLSCCPRRQIGV
jgi:hypothetical protein